jgi:hypothetical protein
LCGDFVFFGPLLQLRQAEVEGFHHAPAGDKHIGRLDIAMNDAFLVCSCQPIGYMRGNLPPAYSVSLLARKQFSFTTGLFHKVVLHSAESARQ